MTTEEYPNRKNQTSAQKINSISLYPVAEFMKTVQRCVFLLNNESGFMSVSAGPKTSTAA